jgi:hypothetical protein
MNGKMIAQGPFGVDAEVLIPIQVTISEKKFKGTALLKELSRHKHYFGP